MTKQETIASTNKKVSMIQQLAKSLQISITAEQHLGKDNILKTVVYFEDMEKYPLSDPNPLTVAPVSTTEIKEETKNVENSPI